MNTPAVKIWDIVRECYWTNEDGEISSWPSEEDAKAACREEGYTEAYIDNGLEYHPHYNLDMTGYDYQ